ncbi:MAG: hypothetical protein KA113_09050 [Syntrophaceae bacterium]|nr:hypothetical protein [Syntrophaceae bacterium]
MKESFISTKEFAERVLVKPQTIMKGLCVSGHYLFVRPIKLKNRRLLWPEAEVEKAIHGEAA